MSDEFRSLSSLSEDIALRNQKFREVVAHDILTVFRWSVAFTVIMTIILSLSDYAAIWNGVIKPSDQLVSERVLLAIIGSTVVQVGAAVAAIVFSLFRRLESGSSEGG